MRPVLSLTFYIVLMVLFGCATPSYLIKTDATNYSEKLSIEKKDYEFYTGEYVGSEENCFPPIENRRCIPYTSDELYKSSGELSLELFSINITDHTVITSKVVKDMAYLTAAELAEQRGFKTFTPIYTIETSRCASIYSVNTSGNVTNNSYLGTSYLSEDVTCVNLYSIRVLLFDEQADLKQGVLYRSDGNNRLHPFVDLYIGTTPGLYEEYNKQRIEDLEDDNPAILTKYENAWQTQYDIRGLINELRTQYGLKEKILYTFTDERERKKKRVEQEKADPLEKFKVSQ